jgi:hypothetical protein
VSSALIFELENVRSKSRKLEESNEKLIVLLHNILDSCYGERRDCGGIVEDMIIEKGVEIREDFNWDYRKED